MAAPPASARVDAAPFVDGVLHASEDQRNVDPRAVPRLDQLATAFTHGATQLGVVEQRLDRGA